MIKSTLAAATTVAILTVGGANASAANEYFQKDFESLECLALNIYFETHAASLADAMSVSDVVRNRVFHTSYPNSVCEVVKQGYVPGRRDCQFSWYCDGKSDVPKNKTAWEKSRKYARDFYIHGMYVGITEGATHYHATYVKPFWAPTLDRVGRIGRHIFYRIKSK